VVELNFADVDADIRVMGEAPQALSLLESTDRENIKTFLGVGMIECELVR
jgi:hypothetical protein